MNSELKAIVRELKELNSQISRIARSLEPLTIRFEQLKLTPENMDDIKARIEIVKKLSQLFS